MTTRRLCFCILFHVANECTDCWDQSLYKMPGGLRALSFNGWDLGSGALVHEEMGSFSVRKSGSMTPAAPALFIWQETATDVALFREARDKYLKPTRKATAIETGEGTWSLACKMTTLIHDLLGAKKVTKSGGTRKTQFPKCIKGPYCSAVQTLLRSSPIFAACNRLWSLPCNFCFQSLWAQRKICRVSSRCIFLDLSCSLFGSFWICPNSHL